VFTFPDPGTAGVSPPILGFHDVDFNYPGGPTLFKNLNFGLVSAQTVDAVRCSNWGQVPTLALASEPVTAKFANIGNQTPNAMATFRTI
jgi:ATP-binding cassette subfamily F protein 3